MIRQDKTTDIAVKSLAKLQHVGFDDDQAKALVEMTVGLINATTSPILKQLESLRLDIRRVDEKSDNKFELLRADIRRVDKNLDSKIQRVDEKSDNKFELLRADIRRVEKKSDNKFESLRGDIRRVDEKSDDAIKDHKKSNKIMIFGFIGIIAGMVGIIAGLVGVMVTISV